MNKIQNLVFSLRNPVSLKKRGKLPKKWSKRYWLRQFSSIKDGGFTNICGHIDHIRFSIWSKSLFHKKREAGFEKFVSGKEFDYYIFWIKMRKSVVLSPKLCLIRKRNEYENVNQYLLKNRKISRIRTKYSFRIKDFEDHVESIPTGKHIENMIPTQLPSDNFVRYLPEGSIDVKVVSTWGKSFILNHLSSITSIREIKSEIDYFWNLDPLSTLISVNGHYIRNDSTRLEDIVVGSHVTLYVSLDLTGGLQIYAFIEGIKGCQEFECLKRDSVSALRKRINDKKGPVISSYDIFFRGQKLVDSDILGDVGIEAESTIRLKKPSMMDEDEKEVNNESNSLSSRKRSFDEVDDTDNVSVKRFDINDKSFESTELSKLDFDKSKVIEFFYCEENFLQGYDVTIFELKLTVEGPLKAESMSGHNDPSSARRRSRRIKGLNDSYNSKNKSICLLYFYLFPPKSKEGGRSRFLENLYREGGFLTSVGEIPYIYTTRVEVESLMTERDVLNHVFTRFLRNNNISKIHLFSLKSLKRILCKFLSGTSKGETLSYILELEEYKKKKEEEEEISKNMSGIEGKLVRAGRPKRQFDPGVDGVEKDDPFIKSKQKRIKNVQRKILGRIFDNFENDIFEDNPLIKVEVAVRIIDCGSNVYNCGVIGKGDDPELIPKPSVVIPFPLDHRMSPRETLREKSRIRISVNSLRYMIGIGYNYCPFYKFMEFIEGVKESIRSSVVSVKKTVETLTFAIFRELTTICKEYLLETCRTEDLVLQAFDYQRRVEKLKVEGYDFKDEDQVMKIRVEDMVVHIDTDLFIISDKFELLMKDRKGGECRYLKFVRFPFVSRPKDVSTLIPMMVSLEELCLSESNAYFSSLRKAYDLLLTTLLTIIFQETLSVEVNGEVKRFNKIVVNFLKIRHLNDMAEFYNLVFLKKSMFCIFRRISTHDRFFLTYKHKLRKSQKSVEQVDTNHLLTFTLQTLIYFRKGSASRYEGKVPFPFEEFFSTVKDFMGVNCDRQLEMLMDLFHPNLSRSRGIFPLVWLTQKMFCYYGTENQGEYQEALKSFFYLMENKPYNIVKRYFVETRLPVFDIRDDCELNGGPYLKLLKYINSFDFRSKMKNLLEAIEGLHPMKAVIIKKYWKRFKMFAEDIVDVTETEKTDVEPLFDIFLDYSKKKDRTRSFMHSFCGLFFRRYGWYDTYELLVLLRQVLLMGGKFSQLHMDVEEIANLLYGKHLSGFAAPKIESKKDRVVLNNFGETENIDKQAKSMLSNFFVYFRHCLSLECKTIDRDDPVIMDLLKEQMKGDVGNMKNYNKFHGMKVDETGNMEDEDEDEEEGEGDDDVQNENLLTDEEDIPVQIRNFNPNDKLSKNDHEEYLKPVFEDFNECFALANEMFEKLKDFFSLSSLLKLELDETDTLERSELFEKSQLLSNMIKDFQLGVVNNCLKFSKGLVNPGSKRVSFEVSECGSGKSLDFILFMTAVLHNKDDFIVSRFILLTEAKLYSELKKDRSFWVKLSGLDIPEFYFCGSGPSSRSLQVEKWIENENSVLIISYSKYSYVEEPQCDLDEETKSRLAGVLDGTVVICDESEIFNTESKESSSAKSLVRRARGAILFTGEPDDGTDPGFINHFSVSEKIESQINAYLDSITRNINSLNDTDRSMIHDIVKRHVNIASCVFRCKMSRYLVFLNADRSTRKFIDEWKRIFHLGEKMDVNKPFLEVSDWNRVTNIFLSPSVYDGVYHMNETEMVLYRDCKFSDSIYKFTNSSKLRTLLHTMGFAVTNNEVIIVFMMSRTLNCIMDILERLEVADDENFDEGKNLKDLFGFSVKNVHNFDGEVSPVGRRKIIDMLSFPKKFGKYIGLMTPQSGGVGFSCGFSGRVVIIDQQYNPYLTRQCELRIRRMNSKYSHVKSYHFLLDVDWEKTFLKKYNIRKFFKGEHLLRGIVRDEVEAFRIIDQRRRELLSTEDRLLKYLISKGCEISKIVDIDKQILNSPRVFKQ